MSSWVHVRDKLFFVLLSRLRLDRNAGRDTADLLQHSELRSFPRCKQWIAFPKICCRLLAHRERWSVLSDPRVLLALPLSQVRRCRHISSIAQFRLPREWLGDTRQHGGDGRLLVFASCRMESRTQSIQFPSVDGMDSRFGRSRLHG